MKESYAWIALTAFLIASAGAPIVLADGCLAEQGCRKWIPWVRPAEPAPETSTSPVPRNIVGKQADDASDDRRERIDCTKNKYLHTSACAVIPAPEPSTWVLLATAFVLLTFLHNSRKATP